MGAEGTKEPEIEDAGVVAVGPIELDGVRADQAGGDYTHAGGISLEDSQGIVRLLFALRAAGGAGADATKLGQGELAVLSVFPFDEQTLVGDLDLQILGRKESSCGPRWADGAGIADGSSGMAPSLLERRPSA